MAEAERLETVIAKTGSNPVRQILLHQGEFYEWRDYPDGGVWDRETGYGYFYHAHPGAAFPEEHGHFHLFWADAPDRRTNLAALSIDRFGRAAGAFMPNHWHVPLSTDAATLRHYDSYEVALAFPCFAANQWLSAAVRALSPHLGAVHRAGIDAASDSATVNDRGRSVLAARALTLATALASDTAAVRTLKAARR